MMNIDTIVANAKVATLDRALPEAEAFAIADGRIVAIGSNVEVLDLAGAATIVHDMEGRTVAPGFIDTHAHMDREGLRQWYPSLAACRSIADVQAVVAGCAATRPAGEWIVTGPLGEPPFHLNLPGILREGRYPDRHDLDRVAPKHPVWLRAIWGLWSNDPPFVQVLNSAALAACGIDRDTPAPASTVTIEHDDAGEPTGRIFESSVWPAAEFTILRATPPWTTAMRTAALENAMSLSLAAGTTGVFEGHGVAAELHKIYKTLHDRGDQRVRATFPLSLPPFSDVREAIAQLEDWAHYANGPGFGDDRLRTSGVYLEYAGEDELSAVAAQAWPYTGWAGFLPHRIAPDDYLALCRTAARLRLRVATVIAMDLDEVLTVWERVQAETPIDDLRWVLVHGRGMQPQRDYPRIRRLGAVVTTQPSSYLHRSGLNLVKNGFDPDALMAHRDYLDHDIPWSLSTDNKPYGLLFTLWCAVTRIERVRGEVLGPSQRVSVGQALHALSAAGAYASFTERHVGTLSIGKFADAIAFSDDPFTIAPESLKDLSVAFTMVGGEVMHDARSAREVHSV
jgi:predicted amidohydrolase YtcJ